MSSILFTPRKRQSGIYEIAFQGPGKEGDWYRVLFESGEDLFTRGYHSAQKICNALNGQRMTQAEFRSLDDKTLQAIIDTAGAKYYVEPPVGILSWLIGLFERKPVREFTYERPKDIAQPLLRKVDLEIEEAVAATESTLQLAALKVTGESLDMDLSNLHNLGDLSALSDDDRSEVLRRAELLTCVQRLLLGAKKLVDKSTVSARKVGESETTYNIATGAIPGSGMRMYLNTGSADAPNWEELKRRAVIPDGVLTVEDAESILKAANACIKNSPTTREDVEGWLAVATDLRMRGYSVYDLLMREFEAVRNPKPANNPTSLADDAESLALIQKRVEQATDIIGDRIDHWGCDCDNDDTGPCTVCELKEAIQVLRNAELPIVRSPNYRRLRGMERHIFDQWKKRNEQRSNGYTALEGLLANKWGFMGQPIVPDVSQRDMDVATAVVQWMGTNCGSAMFWEAERLTAIERKNRSDFNLEETASHWIKDILKRDTPKLHKQLEEVAKSIAFDFGSLDDKQKARLISKVTAAMYNVMRHACRLQGYHWLDMNERPEEGDKVISFEPFTVGKHVHPDKKTYLKEVWTSGNAIGVMRKNK